LGRIFHYCKYFKRVASKNVIKFVIAKLFIFVFYNMSGYGGSYHEVFDLEGSPRFQIVLIKQVVVNF
jgi:hypothetical protein